ncbi:hypothetical protein [Clostridium grantii]|uniref:Uncharacterized protein n=1 Tax=Clostridium grantii DSM 8605 TaxID=1121316 RepID=A0A1M5V6N6_9CLOT|nr:hypothetical protein [Clostridium grantii]SHH70942.1 hypothetical protein SAMN02745207_02128 [Clostridium grantii DSM 8605]
MANTFTLTMTSIALDAISIELGSTASTTLIDSMIKIRKFNGSTFDDYTDFTVSGASDTVATINPNTDFSQTDMILIQIQDGTDYSDRVLVDFAQDYDETNHDADYKYELPAQTGSYKIQLDTVNGTDFSTVESAAFAVGNAPTGATVSIAKDYLVKYTGQVLDVIVTLTGTDIPAGNYEVSIDADLQ